MFWPLLVPSAQADTFDVGPGQPYADVNAAAVAAFAASDEDHVIVIHDSGSYTESKTVVTENLRVEAVAGERPTLLSTDNNNGIFHVTGAVRLELAGLILDGQSSRRVVHQAAGTVLIDDVDFQHIGGNRGGGAILADGSSVSLELRGCDFVGATITGNSNGAFVGVNTGDLTVTGSTFTQGSSERNGGAIAFQSGGVLTVSGTDFSMLHAHNRGGAIFIGSGTATIDTSTFDGNDAPLELGGGAIYVEAGSLHVIGGSFQGNAATSGGAIRANAAVTTLEGVTFTLNTSTVQGGAVYANTPPLTVLGGTFDRNSSPNGGGIYVSSGDLVVDGATFTSNTANGNGGAILVWDASGTSTVSSSTFLSNAATVLGGAIYRRIGTSTYTENTFCGNGANSGGALWFEAADSTVTRSVFLGNTSVGAGGTAFVNTGTLVWSHDSEAGSSGATGHAIYSAAANATIRDSYFGSRFVPGAVVDAAVQVPSTSADHNGYETGPPPPLGIFVADGGLNVMSGSLIGAPSGCDPYQLVPPAGSTLEDAASDNGDIGAFDDLDGDGFRGPFDCDETDPLIHQGATEVVGDEIDQDCDGAELCWADVDLDGDRSDTATVASPDLACADPGEALATAPVDCDDTDPAYASTATEIVGDNRDQDCDGHDACYEDLDRDGYGSDVVVVATFAVCIASGEVRVTGDCDDADPSVSPDGTELVADEVDSDCDGTEICYLDGDGDGHGTTTTIQTALGDTDCADPGESTLTDDCDDADIFTYPGASESAGNDVDEDCDGTVICFADIDLDDARSLQLIQTQPGDTDCAGLGEAYIVDPIDCDDTDPAVYPGAPEVTGDEVDQNCDGREVCWRDMDRDGYRSDVDVLPSLDEDCNDLGEAATSAPIDCDDNDPASSYVQPELPGDNIDSDCDGTEICFDDVDQDGARTNTTTISSDTDCNDPTEALATAPLDCEPLLADVHPGATEIVGDGQDQDCDGIELCYEDLDHDGVGSSVEVPGPERPCTAPGEAPISGDPCPLDALDLDSDGDGVCDTDDLCPGPDDLDTDGDGTPNGCETECTGADEDGDTVPDDCDLCPGEDDRIDPDGDGLPAACDPDEDPVLVHSDTPPTGDTALPTHTGGAHGTGDTSVPSVVARVASASGDPGCGCRTGSSGALAGWMALVLVVARRRQRAPQQRL
ncbi:MAG: hypothetical protein H6735_16030 [Alphaproteobacteria bacterium]|nr:hypothetical protein [Alphaproteobacteria bacterium]